MIKKKTFLGKDERCWEVIFLQTLKGRSMESVFMKSSKTRDNQQYQ